MALGLTLCRTTCSSLSLLEPLLPRLKNLVLSNPGHVFSLSRLHLPTLPQLCSRFLSTLPSPLLQLAVLTLLANLLALTLQILATLLGAKVAIRSFPLLVLLLSRKPSDLGMAFLLSLGTPLVR